MAGVDNPPEREVKEFIFEQLCKFRVTPAQDVGKERIQHLASSSKYGLVFIAVSEGLKVVNTQDIVNLDNEHSRERSEIIIPDLPTRALVPISHPISHVALSCDDLTLAVACTCTENANIILYMYDVRAFSQPNAIPNPFKTFPVNGSPTLADIHWNPEAANTILACTADGHIELLEIDDDDIKIETLPTSTNACCVCWSPNGVQFVVGKNDGTLAQYDKYMVLEKNWSCPPILKADAGPYKVIDVLWLSTYMFLVAYLPQSEDPTDQPLVVLITSSEEGKTTYANFEDICFGSGEERKAKYYMNLILKRDMAVIGSANATETTIVFKNHDDKVTWEHWILEDSGRAELPLTESKCDSFPVGFSISYYSTVSDGNAASPLLLLLSTDGLLVPFCMKYSHADRVAITTPLAQLTLEEERNSTSKATVSSAKKANSYIFDATQKLGTNSQQTSSLFGNSSSTSGFSASGGFGGGGGGGGSFSQSASVGVSATGFRAATTSPVSGRHSSAPNSAFGASANLGGISAITPELLAATSSGLVSSAPFGSPSGPPTSFTGFNSAGSPSFGSIAQTSDQPSFGSVGQTSEGFGNQPSSGGQQPQSFGSPNQGGFGNSSSFSKYR